MLADGRVESSENFDGEIFHRPTDPAREAAQRAGQQ
jgi:hypothetical protein